MRTKYPFIFVLALGTGVLIFQGSGLSALYEPDPTADLQSGQRISEQANKSMATQGGKFKFANQGGDSLIGGIIAGASQLLGVVGVVVLLPFELEKLGLPPWAAFPLGGLGQIVISIGLIEFLTGREFT